MIDSIQEQPINVLSNASVTFLTDAVRTNSATCCGWLQHEQGSSQFTLTRCGIYEIEFNANITSVTTGTASLAVRSNGEVLPGTQMDYVVATAGAYRDVAANRLVKVCGNASKTITISNVGTIAVDIKNANIIIKKVA